MFIDEKVIHKAIHRMDIPKTVGFATFSRMDYPKPTGFATFSRMV
jgi:hypothetical protein